MLLIVNVRIRKLTSPLRIKLMNYDMDGDHHDEEVSLEDVEIEKDTADSTE